MAQSSEELQSDAALIEQGWTLLGRFPDAILWEDPNGLRYAIGAKVNFLNPKR